MADRITLEQVLTDEPLWMAVGFLEPDRKIEVEATYKELIAIRKLWDRYHEEPTVANNETVEIKENTDETNRCR